MFLDVASRGFADWNACSWNDNSFSGVSGGRKRLAGQICVLQSTAGLINCRECCFGGSGMAELFCSGIPNLPVQRCSRGSGLFGAEGSFRGLSIGLLDLDR